MVFPPLPAAGCWHRTAVLAAALTPSSQRGSGSAVLGADGASGGDLAGSGTSGLEGGQPPLPSSVLRWGAPLRAGLQSDLGFSQEKQESPENGPPFHVPPSGFGPWMAVMHAESRASPKVMWVVC